MVTSHCLHTNTCTRNVLMKFLRGLFLGSAIKIPIDLIIRTIKFIRSKRENQDVKEKGTLFIFSKHFLRSYYRNVILKLINSDNIQFVSFMSILVSLFPAILCCLRRIRTEQQQQPMNFAIAGGISAAAILLEKKSRRSEIAIYLISRAVTSAWKLCVDHKILPKIPAGEIILFAVVASVTQYTFTYEPELMRKQYFQFIDDLAKDPQGRLDKFLLQMRCRYHSRMPKGYQVMDRSACNTDFYYTNSLSPPDPENYFPEHYKPFMTTGDSDCFDVLDKRIEELKNKKKSK